MKIVDQTFLGHPRKEGLEILDKLVTIRRCHFSGGSTNLRFNNCTVLVEDSHFSSAKGPADPDGQCIQLLRSVGIIRNCTFEASYDSEDLLSIFADQPIPGDVLIDSCRFLGRGKSDSGNSICFDGAHCPPTTVRNCSIGGARCGITVAGGRNHVVSGVTIGDSDNSIYVDNLYGGRHFGPVLIQGCTLSVPVLLGHGMEDVVKVKP